MRHLPLAALLVVSLSAGVVQAADRFVSKLGDDAGPNDCLVAATPCRTVGLALAQMASGDTVKIAEGRYQESLFIVTAGTSTLSGGWRTDFSAQDATKPTTLSGGKFRGLLVQAGTGEVINTTLRKLTIAGSKVTDPLDAGAGIRAEATGTGSLTLTLDEVTLMGNKALKFAAGGGLALVKSGTATLTATIERSLFTKNKASDIGGAVYVEVDGGTAALTVTVTDTTFSANKAPAGGAVYSSIFATSGTASLGFERSKFLKNKAKLGDGGAIISELHGGSVNLTLVNTALTDNTAKFDGGALFARTNGGGLTQTIQSRNSTFTRNKAGNDGGAMRLQAAPGAPATVTATSLNDIIWGNQASNLGEDVFLRRLGSATLSFTGTTSNVNDLATDGGPSVTLTGNPDVDPMVVKKDFHLATGSPMIGAGTCAGAPADDIDGDVRGVSCDIGADEFVP